METNVEIQSVDELPNLDISESVTEFTGTSGKYYAHEFGRVQESSSGYCWTFNLGSALFGPLWATARGLWGLFWVFSVLELIVIVMIGLGSWGDLGSDQFARAEKLAGNYERMMDRVESAIEQGDEEGAASFRKRADGLLKAQEKALAQAKEAEAGATRIFVAGLILLVLVKVFEGLVANIAYERQYTRWRTDKKVRSGFNWSNGILGAVIVSFVYVVTLMRFTSGNPPEIITEFPIDNTIYLQISAWIDYWFDIASRNFAFLFLGISRTIRIILDGVETLLVGTPWPVVMVVIIIFAYRSAGPRVAIFTAAALCYLAVFGFWQKSMATVALLGTASFLCIAIGIPLGVWFARSQRAYAFARPVLDLMQTLPSFVYLIPIIAFFGTGKPPGILASMIFGLPPIIRLTALGIREVPKDVVEAARAFGATDMQILRGIEVPLATPSIMAGVNQTIMMCLSLVVIAALIDAKGLGYDVLVALQYAAKGQGILAGIAILFCAIVIDRVVQGRFKDTEKGG
ncbi:MAG: proline/glycine betaine ABC transporter permease [Gammaproteobacteria bacterium]|nr:proline/glycine betaine ABC transporter permease [Gammaproteobacteria bacterium]MCY4217987.1 proline/glycine betaine ABC transporter permease [Gammaproteobacteria bacterium]